jgi:hypothetical protein
MRLLAATFIFAASSVAAPAIDQPRLLAAIANKEAHRWSDPGGAYAIRPITWAQHSKLPYRFASLKDYADPVALRHLQWLTRSLEADGYQVTVYALAGCWRHGLEGWKLIRTRDEYAEGVWNLYYSTHAKL